ncbi:MAG: hypothetical protein GC159_02105 [Phycisphaera sp.]|nr:hypothetical protein [Phycisphaera sp.]
MRHAMAITLCGAALAMLSTLGAPTRAADAPSNAKAATPTPTKADAQPSWDRYRVIVERSIFAQSRTTRVEKPRETTEKPVEAPKPEPVVEAPKDPGTYYGLVGVSRVGERWMAFFEDARDGSIKAVAPGDTLAGRRIESVTLDTVTAATDDKTSDVAIGYTLTGAARETPAKTATRPSTSSPTSTASKPASSSTQTQPAEAPSGDAASLLERLRQRRAQELGK